LSCLVARPEPMSLSGQWPGYRQFLLSSFPPHPNSLIRFIHSTPPPIFPPFIYL
jgi:hypothetical protein